MHEFGTVAEKGGATMPVFAHKQSVLLFLLSLSACVPARVAQPIQMRQTADSSITCDQMAVEYKTNTEIAGAKIAKNNEMTRGNYGLVSWFGPGCLTYK